MNNEVTRNNEATANNRNNFWSFLWKCEKNENKIPMILKILLDQLHNLCQLLLEQVWCVLLTINSRSAWRSSCSFCSWRALWSLRSWKAICTISAWQTICTQCTWRSRRTWWSSYATLQLNLGNQLGISSGFVSNQLSITSSFVSNKLSIFWSIKIKASFICFSNCLILLFKNFIVLWKYSDDLNKDSSYFLQSNLSNYHIIWLHEPILSHQIYFLFL